jgi:hypothetical protein
VEATPNACEECLVPNEVFLISVNQAFEDKGIAAEELNLELVYPKS